MILMILLLTAKYYKSSSQDDTANVNFFCDDIVQVQNITVSNEAEVCKNSKIRLAVEFENNNE